VEDPEKREIVVEVGWQFLVLAAALAVALALAWASGVFHELFFSLSSFLQPIELTLSSDSYPPDGTVDISVCITEWLKTYDLSLVIISPEGIPIHFHEIRVGSDNCMRVSVKLRGATEGIYTVAVIRRSKALSTARFKVVG